VYYGINQASQGPAIRDVGGYKLMMVDSRGGGGKGEWSLEQLPNASSSTAELLADTQAYALGLGLGLASGAVQTVGQGGAACHIQTETCYPGNDLDKLVLGTIDECCAACAANETAAGFTFRQNPPGQPTCFLKRKLGKPSRTGCTSGYKAGRHPVPPAPPAPAPAPAVPEGHLLYNVISDPGERTPLDMTNPAHAAVVKKLIGIAQSYEATKVPQAVGDPACPPFSGLNTTAADGTTQLFIGPWCDEEP
jgi:hypothetical protein